MGNMARESGKKEADRIVLAGQNDSFPVGRLADLALAVWFTEIWQRFGEIGLYGFPPSTGNGVGSPPNSKQQGKESNQPIRVRKG